MKCHYINVLSINMSYPILECDPICYLFAVITLCFIPENGTGNEEELKCVNNCNRQIVRFHVVISNYCFVIWYIDPIGFVCNIHVYVCVCVCVSMKMFLFSLQMRYSVDSRTLSPVPYNMFILDWHSICCIKNISHSGSIFIDLIENSKLTIEPNEEKKIFTIELSIN